MKADRDTHLPSLNTHCFFNVLTPKHIKEKKQIVNSDGASVRPCHYFNDQLERIQSVRFGTIAEWLMLKIGLETKIRLTRDSQK